MKNICILRDIDKVSIFVVLGYCACRLTFAEIQVCFISVRRVTMLLLQEITSCNGSPFKKTVTGKNIRHHAATCQVSCYAAKL
jgi:hypothetical protein